MTIVLKRTFPIVYLQGILGCIIFLYSCGNDSPYKKFSLKDITEKNDSIKKHSDSINLARKSINADKKENAITALFDAKAKDNGFNGSVLVSQQGIIIFKKAYGYANYEKNIKLTPSTPFEIASTSKTLTAAAIMLLNQQGKLSYDDNVKKYFPNFPYEGITIKLLLTHRSGLPNYMYFCDSLYTDQCNLLTNKKVLEIIEVHQPPMYYKPNKKFEYCNTNYCLLASIVEKISKTSFPEFMNENIFIPLKMSNTWVQHPDSIHKSKTLAYHGNWKIEEGDFLDGVYGDKGVHSTVEDLFLWDQELYNHKLLTHETVEEAFKGYSNEKKGTRNYGFGFRTIEHKNGQKTVYHNGWWHCYNSTFYRDLGSKTTIIILSNKLNKGIYNISEVLNILYSSNPNNTIELE